MPLGTAEFLENITRFLSQFFYFVDEWVRIIPEVLNGKTMRFNPCIHLPPYAPQQESVFVLIF